MSTPANDSGLNTQLRTLATEIAQTSNLGFNPSTNSKGVITAISNGPPVTVTVNMSGDTTIAVTGVRLLDGYTPRIGNTVLLEKQGSQLFVKGGISATDGMSVGGADGWIRASIAAGAHNGNGNGDIYYRKVLDAGSWRMEWRGGWVPNGNFLISTPLPPTYWPSSKRSVLAAREIQSGSCVIQFDFKSDGTAEMIGANVAPFGDYTDPGTSFNGEGGGTTAGGTDGHSHGVFGDGHTHSTGHSHSNHVDYPAWVSLNGVHYYL